MKHLLPLLLLLIAGCRPIRYIPLTTQEHSRDTIHLTTIRHDSIHLHDSIYILQEQKGDTIRITTTKYQYRDRTKMIHDTIRAIHRDTVIKPVTIPATDTTARPTWRDKIKSALIIILSLIFITFVLTGRRK